MNSMSTECMTKKTILVVDDNPANLHLLTSLLRERDYDVRPAIKASLALATMELELPDLILLDVKMPEMDGYELCRQLKADERAREIPVVFISGLDQSIDRVRAFDAGGVDYITKPFQCEEVLARVKTHIDLRCMQKRLEEANKHLRGSHEELERRVRERTSQLVVVNEQLKAVIIEREQAEEKLKQSEERYRLLFENAPIGCQTLDQSGRLIDVNRAWLDILGYSKGDVLERWSEDFIAPKHVRRFQELFSVLVNGGVVVGQALQMVRKDGSTVDVELDGVVTRHDWHDWTVRAYCMIRDITQMKQADEAIHAILESASGALGYDYFDKIVGIMCEWLNCEHAVVCRTEDGLTARAPSMQSDGIIYHDVSYSLVGTPCSKVLHEGLYHCPEGVSRLFPDDPDLVRLGAEGYVGVALRNKAGKATGVLCALSRQRLNLPRRAEEVLSIIAARASAEIERMTLEEDKRVIEKQLNQIQKMEAIGTLAGGIAHDFNNILAPIIGYAELSMQKVPDGSRMRGDLEQILMAANRAKELVMQILSFSRQTEQEPKPIQVSLIVKEAAKFLRASLPSTIEISAVIAPDVMQSKIIGDPTQLHQVLMNLCVNAGHAMLDGGGRLEIELSNADVEAEFVSQYPGAKPGRYLKLTVTDTGHGMDQEVMQRIFEPYFTTKGPGRGTGLGLSVAYGIVNGCGGWIDVESRRGRGSTFDVFLPVIERPAEPEREPGPVDFCCSGRVLLVDDEEAIVHLGKEMLEKFGFEVVAIRSSIEALDTFRSAPESFALVITDLTMPGMTGMELAQSLLKITPELPIILCTGFSESINAEEARKCGFSGFIMKPMSMTELADTIRGALEGGVKALPTGLKVYQGMDRTRSEVAESVFQNAGRCSISRNSFL